MPSSHDSAFRLFLIPIGFNIVLFVLGIVVLAFPMWGPEVFPDWSIAPPKPERPIQVPIVGLLLFLIEAAIRFVVALLIYLVVGVGLTVAGLIGMIWTAIGVIVAYAVRKSTGESPADAPSTASLPNAGVDGENPVD